MKSNNLAASLNAKIKVDTKEVAAAQKKLKKLSDSLRKGQRLNVSVDTKSLEKNIQSVSKKGVTIKVNADTANAARDINRISDKDVTVRVKADTADAKREIEGINFNGLNRGAESSDLLSSSFSRLTTASAALGVALAANQARFNVLAKEIELSAQLANISTDEMQSFAYAAQTVNISMEKTSDILKDVNDKVGDFTSTNGGEFKELFESYIEPMGHTVEQMREMSSTEVLGLLVKGMDEASASMNEQVFAMEALANDATLLLPLLKDNGAALKELSESSGAKMSIIDEEQLRRAEEAREVIRGMTDAMRAFSNFVADNVNKALLGLNDSIQDVYDKMLLIKSQDVGAVVPVKLDFDADEIRKLDELGFKFNEKGIPVKIEGDSGDSGEELEEAIKLSNFKKQQQAEQAQKAEEQEKATLANLQEQLRYESDRTKQLELQREISLKSIELGGLDEQQKRTATINVEAKFSDDLANLAGSTKELEKQKAMGREIAANLQEQLRYEEDKVTQLELQRQIALQSVQSGTLDNDQKEKANLSIERKYQEDLAQISIDAIAEQEALERQAFDKKIERLKELQRYETDLKKQALLQQQIDLEQLTQSDLLNEVEKATAKVEINKALQEELLDIDMNAMSQSFDAFGNLFDGISDIGSGVDNKLLESVGETTKGALKLAEAGIQIAQAQIFSDPTVPWYTKIATAASFGISAAKLFSGLSGGGGGSSSGASSADTANNDSSSGSTELYSQSNVAAPVVNVTTNVTTDPITGESLAEVMTGDQYVVNSQMTNTSKNQTEFNAALGG